MRYVTQLIIHISHFVRVARRSNGLQPYRLFATHRPKLVAPTEVGD